MSMEYYGDFCSIDEFLRVKIENAELKQQNKKLIGENEKMQDQLLQYDELLKEKNKEIKKCKETNSSHVGATNKLHIENQELTKKVDSYEQRIDELVLALHDAETENRVLRELLLESGKPVAKVKVNPQREVKRYSCENKEIADG